MATEPGQGDVSRYAFQVAYEGGDSADHAMDVEALAPALLGFGRLIREANAVLNHDRAEVKVLVTSDFEHKCFNINFELVQTILQRIKGLLKDDHVQTAVELLKTLGVVGTAVGSLFGFLKWRKGREIKAVQEIKDTTASGTVILQIHVEGNENQIQIPADVFKLAQNPKVLNAQSKRLFRP